MTTHTMHVCLGTECVLRGNGYTMFLVYLWGPADESTHMNKHPPKGCSPCPNAGYIQVVKESVQVYTLERGVYHKLSRTFTIL